MRDLPYLVLFSPVPSIARVPLNITVCLCPSSAQPEKPYFLFWLYGSKLHINSKYRDTTAWFVAEHVQRQCVQSLVMSDDLLQNMYEDKACSLLSYVRWFIAEHVRRQGMRSFELCLMVRCRTCTKTMPVVFWVMSDGSLQNIYKDNVCSLLSYVWCIIAEHVQRQCMQSFELRLMVHCRTYTKTRPAVFWVMSDGSLQNMFKDNASSLLSYVRCIIAEHVYKDSACSLLSYVWWFIAEHVYTKTSHAVFWVMCDGSLQSIYKDNAMGFLKMMKMCMEKEAELIQHYHPQSPAVSSLTSWWIFQKWWERWRGRHTHTYIPPSPPYTHTHTELTFCPGVWWGFSWEQ